MISMAPPPKAGAQPAAGDALLDTMKAMLEETKRSNLARKSEMQQTLDNAKKDIIATAFGPVLKFVEAISKMIALFIMPFVNLLMPLLMPLLYFLSPIVKFLNIMLRPLLIKMMEAAKAASKDMTGAASDLLSGAGNGLVNMFSSMGKLIETFFTEIKPYISGFTDWLIKFLQSIDIEKFLTDVWNTVSGVLTKIWDAIAPSLEAIWDKLAPWLKEQFPDLFALVNDIKTFITTAGAAFGPGPAGLVGAIVAQAKFFAQDVSNFIFQALAEGLKLAYGVQKGITQALISVTSTIFDTLDSLDANVFVPFLKLIRDIVVPVGDALFKMIVGIDQKIILPFRQAAALLIPAIKAFAQPLNLFAQADFLDAVSKTNEIQPLIDQKAITSFEQGSKDLKDSLTKTIEDLPARMAARSELEYTIESSFANLSGDVQTLITTLQEKADGLQQSIDKFLEVRDVKGNVITKDQVDELSKTIDENKNTTKSLDTSMQGWVSKYAYMLTTNKPYVESPRATSTTPGVALQTAVEKLTSAMQTKSNEPQQPISITLRIVDSAGNTAKQYHAVSGTNMTYLI